MRTKTLLVAAALSAVGVATSLAQVYSVNAVGYVNLSLKSDAAGGSAFGTVIANPLNATNNSLDTILPLSNAYDGSIVYRFNVTGQTWADPIQFYAGTPGTWFTASGSLDIAPGEAFFIFPNGPDPLSVTFVGEVPQGTLVNALPGANKLALLSSIVPQTAKLGDAVTAGTLLFAAEDGDVVYIFDSTTRSYKDPYQYYAGTPGSWFSASDPDPAGPNVPVATGFFVQKAATSTATSWSRTFSVNP